MNTVIASAARQSLTFLLIAERLPRQFDPRNDDYISGSLNLSFLRIIQNRLIETR